MLTPITAAKIDHGLARLALDQLTGAARPPGEVTLSDIARRADVSEATIRQIEKTALAKIAAGLLAQGDLPPHLARQISQALSKP